MSGTGDLVLCVGLASERRLRVLKQAFHLCLAGDAICLALIATSSFFPRRVGIDVAGFSILAALALFFLSLLFRLWHASRSLAMETEEALRTGFAITQKAEEMGRQWTWATALCGLPRWRGNRIIALRKLK